MFEEIQLVMNARIAINASQTAPEKWDLLVTKLIERTGLDKNTVITKIGQLARGDTNV